MATTSIKWNVGEGYIYVTPSSGDNGATLTISSDANSGNSRTQDIPFTATGANGKTFTRIVTVHQIGAILTGYDGYFAATVASLYTRTINGETASSSYDASTDTEVDGGNAQ